MLDRLMIYLRFFINIGQVETALTATTIRNQFTTAPIRQSIDTVGHVIVNNHRQRDGRFTKLENGSIGASENVLTMTW